jgi:hypothetical protein
MNTNELLTDLLHTLHLRSLAASDEARKNMGAHAERLESQLRAELAALAPLAEAAVNWRKVLGSQNVTAHMFDAVQDALEDAADAYAQAQDGAA